MANSASPSTRVAILPIRTKWASLRSPAKGRYRSLTSTADIEISPELIAAAAITPTVTSPRSPGGSSVRM